MFRFSASQMNLMRDCPRCFWLAHRKHVKRPRGIFSGLPGAIDRILQSITATHAGKSKPSWLLPDIEGIIRAGAKKMTTKDETLKYILTGIVDDIIVTDSGNYFIIDYKTAAKPYDPEKAQYYYGLQMDCLAYLCEANNIIPVKGAYLVFFTPSSSRQPPNNNSFPFKFSITHIKLSVDIQHAKEICAKAAKLCMQEHIPPAASDCEYCKFKDQTI
ncbi:hypothetical protein DRN97_04420 [Methanosarcinales archaeon]|nr:MAG: hypothetical protein DRN97_04420 [Methanosarcinales archaeon]